MKVLCGARHSIFCARQKYLKLRTSNGKSMSVCRSIENGGEYSTETTVRIPKFHDGPCRTTKGQSGTAFVSGPRNSPATLDSNSHRENGRMHCIAAHKYPRNSSFRQKVAPHCTRYGRFGPHKAHMERHFLKVPGIPPRHWRVIRAAKTVERTACHATSTRPIRRFTKKCHPPFPDLAVLALKRKNRGMGRRSHNNLKNDTKNYWAPETGVTLAILGAKLYFHPYTSLQF